MVKIRRSLIALITALGLNSSLEAKAEESKDFNFSVGVGYFLPTGIEVNEAYGPGSLYAGSLTKFFDYFGLEIGASHYSETGNRFSEQRRTILGGVRDTFIDTSDISVTSINGGLRFNLDKSIYLGAGISRNSITEALHFFEESSYYELYSETRELSDQALGGYGKFGLRFKLSEERNNDCYLGIELSGNSVRLKNSRNIGGASIAVNLQFEKKKN